MVLDGEGIVRWLWKTDNPGEWIGLAEVQKHIPA
jgi:hypothetical protein